MRSKVSVANQTEAKRKVVSPLEERNACHMKKPRRQVAVTYAEAYGKDNEDERTLVNRCRRFKSRIESTA